MESERKVSEPRRLPRVSRRHPSFLLSQSNVNGHARTASSDLSTHASADRLRQLQSSPTERTRSAKSFVDTKPPEFTNPMDRQTQGRQRPERSLRVTQATRIV